MSTRTVQETDCVQWWRQPVWEDPRSSLFGSQCFSCTSSLRCHTPCSSAVVFSSSPPKLSSVLFVSASRVNMTKFLVICPSVELTDWTSSQLGLSCACTFRWHLWPSPCSPCSLQCTPRTDLHWLVASSARLCRVSSSCLALLFFCCTTSHILNGRTWPSGFTSVLVSMFSWSSSQQWPIWREEGCHLTGNRFLKFILEKKVHQTFLLNRVCVIVTFDFFCVQFY